MSGHIPSSGPGQHGAQQSTQEQHQSRTQGPPEGPSHMLPPYSRKQRSVILAAETKWRAKIRQWFPALHSQTYFVPPLHFSRVSYGVRSVAGLPVLVLQEVSDQPHQRPYYFPDICPPPNPSDPPLASRVWPLFQPVPPGKLPLVIGSDAKVDRAVLQVREFIQRVAETRQEAMLVLCQLRLEQCLYSRVNNAVRLLPQLGTLGLELRQDYYMLIINGLYSLVVIKVKSVGASHANDPGVIKRVGVAIGQLDRAKTVLQHLISDLAPVRITKVLALPNIESKKLEEILAVDKKLRKGLCRCLGVPRRDAAAAVSRCLLADDISDPTSSVWWQRTVTDHGPDANMTPELYERLAARMCGPPTPLEVPCVMSPCRRLGLKNEQEAVAVTGQVMSVPVLSEEQLLLLVRGPRLVFLTGPPGTGKSRTLYLMALIWARQGHKVHILSTTERSRAVTFLLAHQLQRDLHPDSVVRHHYDFQAGESDDALDELTSTASDGQLYIIVDEAGPDYGEVFENFCCELLERVPDLYLWAATVFHERRPQCLGRVKLTAPRRCPGTVQREVAKCLFLKEQHILDYTSSPVPAPTEGPRVKWLPHAGQPGHSQESSEDCEKCASNIADILAGNLRVGSEDGKLQYRDVFILCNEPKEDSRVISGLGSRGVPVQVVRKGASDEKIRDVALAETDAVTVTDAHVSTGLERRVIVGMGLIGRQSYSRLLIMSRCTAQLIWIDPEPDPDQ